MAKEGDMTATGSMNKVHRGQFWVNPMEVYVFINKTFTHKDSKKEIYFCLVDAVEFQLCRYEEDFVADFALVEDREVILQLLLPTLLGQVPSTKREAIVRCGVLGLSEEEKGLIYLNMLNRGEE